MLSSSIVFGSVSGIVREGEGLPCSMGWGNMLVPIACV
jgi:hypothetical protein